MGHLERLMRKSIVIILILTVLCFACGCQSKSAEIKNNDFENGMPDTFSVPIDDIATLEDRKLVGYIYFSRETCPVCMIFNAYIDACLETSGNPVIYKFDTDMWRENEKFQAILDEYQVSAIPTLVRIYDDKTMIVFESDAETEKEFIKDLIAFLSD